MNPLDGLFVALAGLAVVDLVASTALAGRVLPSLSRRSDGAVRSPLGALLVGAVRMYRVGWSGRNPGVCRFEPSCSTYALGALRTFGGVRGGALVAYRLLRCQPLSAGGFDPVPVRRGRRDRSVESGPRMQMLSVTAGPAARTSTTNLMTSADPAAGAEHRLGTRA